MGAAFHRFERCADEGEGSVLGERGAADPFETCFVGAELGDGVDEFGSVDRVDLNSIQLGDYATDVLHGVPAPAKPSALKGYANREVLSARTSRRGVQAARGRP